MILLSRNEELLQYTGCRPAVVYLSWHGSLWISCAPMVRHPKECVLCPLKTMAPAFQANMHSKDGVGPDTNPGLALCAVEKD